MAAPSEVREALQGDVLVVYHWLPDHFLAALLAIDHLLGSGGRIDSAALPGPGAGPRVYEWLAVESRKFDAVLLLGPGWTGAEIDMAATNVTAALVVVDNSYNYITPRRPNVVYFNPAPRGDPRGNFPSLTFTLSLAFGDASSLLVAASIVGLIGERAAAVRAYQNSMARNGLHPLRDMGLPMECAMRALGATAMGDPVVMGRAPLSVAEASMGDLCRALLDDALLASQQGMLEAFLEGLEPEREGPAALLPGARPALLGHVAMREAFASGSPRAAASEEAICAWSPLRDPLARRLQEARARGARGFSVYQGVVNYLCVSHPRPRELAGLLLGG